MADSFSLKILGSKILEQACDRMDVASFMNENPGHFLWLHDFMVKNQGIGIAAPQVGDPQRYFIIHRDLAVDGHWIFINPEITSSSEDVCSYREGCLSLPGVGADVDRPSTISIRALDQYGVQFSISDITGIPARVIQHEADHLDGKLMIDRIDSVQRSLLSGKIKRVRRLNRSKSG